MIMKSARGKYIIKKIDHSRISSGLIILQKDVPKSIIGEIISCPDGSIYKQGDVVIVNKHLSNPFGGIFSSVANNGIIAKYKNGSKNIEDIEIDRNYVLIKITADTSKIKVADTELFIDTSWKEQFHAPTFGEVVALPNRLVFDKRKNVNGGWLDGQSVPFKTDIEVEIGDTVHFHYNSTFNAKNYELLFSENKEEYFITEYQSLFFADKGDSVRMLNGYIAVDIPKDESNSGKLSSGIILVDTRASDKAKSWGRGTVVFADTPNTDYLDWSGTDEREADIGVGDEIAFVASKMSKFGQDMHIGNDKMKGLYRLQRKDVLYKIETADICTQ